VGKSESIVPAAGALQFVSAAACLLLALDCGRTTHDSGAVDRGNDASASDGGTEQVDSGRGTSTGGTSGSSGASGVGGVSGIAGTSATGGASARSGLGGSASADVATPVRCGGVECAPGEECCRLYGKCFDPARPEDCGYESLPQDPAARGRKPCAWNGDCSAGQVCIQDNLNECFGHGFCDEPQYCPMCLTSPERCEICGCDGVTYPDRQTACRAGVSVVLYVNGGACGEPVTVEDYGDNPLIVIPCGLDSQCPTGNRCCPRYGICYDAAYSVLCEEPPPGTRIPCISDAQCFDSEYCFAEGCGTPGGCSTKDAPDCGVYIDPVCGCDGLTYTSRDCARVKGVRVAYAGACG
jgi:hypothetical protein